MKYENIVEGTFIKRVNRFIAEVKIKGKVERVHVPNTGRCREILVPGAKAILCDYSHVSTRKTKYSLVSLYKGDMLINIDSQSPNAIVHEAILQGKVPQLSADFLKREKTFINSRFDLYFERESVKGFVEIKGVTLEKEGLSLFPDAPTLRGRKHLEELGKAVEEGYTCYVLFLLQMKGPKVFSVNKEMDPLFYEEVLKSQDLGVHLLAYDCLVKEDEVVLDEEVSISL